MPILLVEGKLDETIVKQILIRMKISNVEVLPCGGVAELRKRLPALTRGRPDVGALIDADMANIPDARTLARKKLNFESNHVFCAVPEIEAWFFADPDSLPDKGSFFGGHWPLADEIPRPRHLAVTNYGKQFLNMGLPQNFDLGRARLRSPSLAEFLDGLIDLSGSSSAPPAAQVEPALREAVISLIARTYPEKQTLWKTMSGEHTAEEIRKALNTGAVVGDEYVDAVLTVAMDLLRRQAKMDRQR